MSLIAKAEADLLQAHFRKVLRAPVRIDLFVEPEKLHFRAADECPDCAETRALMEEIAELSEKIELKTHVLSAEPEEAMRLGVERVPAVVLSGATRGAVRFCGLPLGSELTGLLDALVELSRGEARLDDEARRALAQLKQEVRLTLFVSESCPFCPRVAQLVHRLAMECEKVKAEVIDLGSFPQLAQERGVLGAPTLLVNGELALAGLQPEALLLGAISRAAGAARSA